MKHIASTILFLLLSNTVFAQYMGLQKQHPLFNNPENMVKIKQQKEFGSPAISNVRNRVTNNSDSLPHEVKPLLADVNLWHQYGKPYNNLTPIVEEQHCPTGCIALAMSQVMHYYRYPERGYGSYEYNDSNGCKEILSSDFSAHKYDWGNMLYEYDYTDYTEQQANAVALLQSDCGISVGMRYSKDASGAHSVSQPISLVKYFGYDKGAQLIYRDFYTYSEILYILKNELASGRPVLISGSNKNNSHAFIIDGYNSNDEFHIMLGNQGGYGDNWTKLYHMTADSPGYGKGTPENGMNILMSFVTGVQPATIDSDKNEYHVFAMKDIVALTTKANRNDSFTIATNDICNIGYNILNDSVVLMLTKNDKPIVPLYKYSHEFLLEELEDTTYSDTLSISFPKDIANGNYKIVPMFKDHGRWQEIKCCVGTPNYLLADVKSDVITLSSDTANKAYLTLEDISISDFMFNGTAQDFTVKVKAHNSELYGRLYVECEPLFENGNKFFMQCHCVNLADGEEREYHYSEGKLWIPSFGRYKLHVYYDDNIFADELIELELPKEYIIEFVTPSRFLIASN